jgi:hypothetical protein
LAGKLAIAGFVVTSGDGYGVFPDSAKLERVLEQVGLARLLEAGREMREKDYDGIGHAQESWDAALEQFQRACASDRPSERSGEHESA